MNSFPAIFSTFIGTSASTSTAPDMFRHDSISTLAQVFLQRIRKRKSHLLAILGALFTVIAFVFLVLPGFEITEREPTDARLPLLRESSGCSVPHSAPDGGDCQALAGMRRPKWACLSQMRQDIHRFLKVYRHRPFKENEGGMRIDHGFALWYVLRNLRPKVVIESGAFKGQSTWIMRQALPNARIISLDPRAPKQFLSGVEYFVENSFRDFNEIDWAKMNVDPDEAVVFFDDHNSLYRRMFMENNHGFYRFIGEDSYDYLQGDNMSLKWVCERRLKDKWKGMVPDNFGRNRTRQSWEEHLRLGDHLKNTLKIYYEFPPVAASSLTGQNRYDPQRASTPIIWDASEFHRLFSSYNMDEFAMYTHFLYTEIDRDVVRHRNVRRNLS